MAGNLMVPQEGILGAPEEIDRKMMEEDLELPKCRRRFGNRCSGLELRPPWKSNPGSTLFCEEITIHHYNGWSPALVCDTFLL